MKSENESHHQLKERVKELTLLHESARILQNYDAKIEDVFNQIVLLIPKAWQYPDITAAKISYSTCEAQTENFTFSPYMQEVRLFTSENSLVMIQVAYLQESPQEVEGPFLQEERNLINSLAQMIASYLSKYELDQALEKRVIQRTEELRAMTVELSMAEERQRRNIASDLHDHIGQTLTAIKMKLQSLQGDNVFSSDYDSIFEIKRLVEMAINYTRSLTVELCPPVLYTLGLESALSFLVDQTKRKYPSLKITFEKDSHLKLLKEDRQAALFRFASELVNNVIKHAKASELSIHSIKRDDNYLLIIRDNGVGFDPESWSLATKSFGLFSIKERISYLGGKMEIKSHKGDGTEVHLSLPLNDRSE